MINSISNRSTNNKIARKALKMVKKINDRVEIANKFNYFITIIGSQQANSIITDSDKNHTHYLDYEIQ